MPTFDFLKTWWNDALAWLWSVLEPVFRPVVKLVMAVSTTAYFAWQFVSTILETIDVSSALDHITQTMTTASSYFGKLPVAAAVQQLNVLFPLNELLFFSALFLALQVSIFGIKVLLFIAELVLKLVGMFVQLAAKIY